MRTSILALSTAFMLSSAALADIPIKDPTMPVKPEPAKIQIALLLDTSNSMDGLIDQAKSQLWMMVNELADARKNGVAPDIEIALYDYGNTNISATKGHVRQISPMSSDLDAVSEKLFELTTRGGEEYTGWAIKTSLEELSWGDSPEDYRLIIVAGNEPYTQGPVSYTTSCAMARAKGIVINTVHCGDYDTGVQTKWEDGATCSGGLYMNINQDDEVIHVATPYDDRLLELNEKINKTYLGYGARGAELEARQLAQDSNAASYGVSNMASRTVSKSKVQYSNTHWDLVDAYEEDADIMSELKPDDLPQELKGLSDDEKVAYVEGLKAQREALKAEIAALDDERKAYIKAEREKMAETETLDQVVVTGARIQASEKGFVFEE